MATWAEFESASPHLADFGGKKIDAGLAYLATVGRDRFPRVHPVTPIIGGGHLLLFMEPDSPKGHDLRRNAKYALNSSVADSEGTGGEFFLRGTATFVEDAELRRLAIEAASYTIEERYVLFELFLDRAMSTVYEDGDPVRQLWREQ